MALGSAVAAQRGVLDRIANPQVINPLAIQAGATQLAGQTYDLRAKQANEAAGQAYQASINPQTGEFDPQEFRRQLASRPNAAIAAGANLKNVQDISSSQLEMQKVALGWYNGALGALDDNAGRDKILSTIQSGVRAGILDPAVAARETAAVNATPDAGLPGYIQQHRVTAASAMDQFHIQNGTPVSVNYGGGTLITPWKPGQTINVPSTLTPAESLVPGITYPATQADVDAGRAKEIGALVHMPGPDVIKTYGYGGLLPPNARIDTAPPASGAGGGVTDSKGNKVGPTNPPRLLVVPGSSSTAAPPAPAPAAPAPAPAPAAPAATPPPATSPTSPGGVPVTANPLSPPGVQIASASNAFAPNVGAPAAPAPAVAGDVAAMLRGVNAARGNVQPAASFSVGPGYQSEASAKGEAATSTERLQADDKLAASYASTIFPQAQALSLLGRGVTTAPNTDFINRIRGNVRGLLGQFGISSFDSTKEYDELHKWLTQIIVSNPAAMGSDSRLAETLAGNANTGIHQLASADMIKTGIALTRMQVAANSEWHSLSPEDQAQFGNNYNAFLRDYNKRVDPRAFAWDMLNPEQKKSLADDLKKHDDAYAQKFLDTRDLARRNGLLDETRAMP